MRITESFNLENYRFDKKVIIYGAGVYGELALRGLQYIGIEPDYFADKRLAGKKCWGIEVINPDNLGDYKEDSILIASSNFFCEMFSEALSKGNKYIYDIEDLILLPYEDSVLSEYALEEKRICSKYSNVINNYNVDGIVVPHLNIVLTERCTLKCKDCANLMQYYKFPENLDMDELIDSFSNFLTAVDLVLSVEILGGEPFIIPDIDKFIKKFVDNEKIKRISIYTNSTIVPAERILSVLKNNKIDVQMSDYGEHSKKIKELENSLKSYGITYYVHKYNEWHDVGDLQKRNYTDAEKKHMYSVCTMAKCHTFYRGKLYLCPRAAHGERLGAFVNNKDEFVDFTTKGIDQSGNWRKNVGHLLKEMDFLTACDYCNGSTDGSVKVKAAVQVNK